MSLKVMRVKACPFVPLHAVFDSVLRPAGNTNRIDPRARPHLRRMKLFILTNKAAGLRRRRTRHCLAAVAAIGLCACSVGPNYRRPPISEPSAWRASEDAAAWPSAEWWRGFGSTQLDDLIAQAQNTNDDIAAAIARVSEADAQARIAGAALLPSLAASGDATHERQAPTTAGSSPKIFSQDSAQLGASYALDFWGKNRAVHDAARLAATASRYDQETVKLTVMTSVALTYFQALELRDRLKIVQDNLASAQNILRGLRLELTVGTTNALDVAQQETAVAILNAAIPPLQQQYGEALNALAVLIGQSPENIDIAAGALADLSEPKVAPGLPSELLARRPDVARAEATLRGANANIKAAKAAFFPSIELTAYDGFASPALRTLFDPASRMYALTAGVTQPIFEGGALSGQYAYAKARYTEYLADYHKAVIAAFSNVEDALLALRQSAEQLQRQQDTVDKAQRAFEFTQRQFRAGAINILTVLNTENALFNAQDTLLQVKYSHLQSVVLLFAALGGGWQQT
jgi:outer membrane protein, multidrug efflux system